MDVGKSKIGDLNGGAASALCYVLGIFFSFIPGIVLLIVDAENPYIKFNAIQSLVLSLVAAVLVCTVIVPIACLIFMIIGAIESNKGNLYKAPIVGDLCAKWADLPPAQ